MPAAVVISPALVKRLQDLTAERRKLDAETRIVKAAEDSIKDQIKRQMGKLKNAPIGATGRTIQLVTVNQAARQIQAYSYTLVNILDPKPAKE